MSSLTPLSPDPLIPARAPLVRAPPPRALLASLRVEATARESRGHHDPRSAELAWEAQRSAGLPGPQSQFVVLGLHHFQLLALTWAELSPHTGRTRARGWLSLDRTPAPHRLAEGPGNTAADKALLTEACVGTKRHVAERLAGSDGGACDS